MQMREVVYDNIDMGQGVIAPLGYDLRSETLTSCIGVAFFNHRSRQVGLFHVAAGGMNSAVEEALMAMCRDMNPEVVYITPAADTMGDGRMGSKDSEIRAVEALIASNSTALIEKEAAKTFASITSDGETINVNSYSELDDFDIKKFVEANKLTPKQGHLTHTIDDNVVLYIAPWRT
jgi:hypothetical protein